MEGLEIAEAARKILDDMKGVDISVLDVHEISSVSDYFVICSGTSSRHVDALGQELKLKLKERGVRASHAEGENSGTWVLLDYFYVMVHIFHPETREFYNLEGLWDEAPRI